MDWSKPEHPDTSSPLVPTQSRLPDLGTLTAHLRRILNDDSSPRSILIIDRRVNEYASTYDTEVVTCLLNGQKAQFLCKYGPRVSPKAISHRNGIAYEVLVYLRILNHSLSSAPFCFGSLFDCKNQNECLVIEFLQDGERLQLSSEQDVAELAARWIGKFHGIHQDQLTGRSLSFLNRYTDDYYRQWAERTMDFAGGMLESRPYLTRVCEGFGDLVPLLQNAQQTIIHGEFFPGNILLRDRVIYPVDWETAAIAAGEIDLAALIEGWTTEVAQRCITEYARARWPDGSPTIFQRTLVVAQLYWCLRWLGDRREWTVDRGMQPIFERLRAIGHELNIL